MIANVTEMVEQIEKADIHRLNIGSIRVRYLCHRKQIVSEVAAFIPVRAFSYKQIYMNSVYKSHQK